VDVLGTLLNVFAIKNGPKELLAVLRNAMGKISADEKTFVPEMEWPKLVQEARLWVIVYALVIGSALVSQSWLPVLLIGLIPGMLGAWLYNYTGLTQHAGLPENVLDHRKNCRTVYMNPVLRFLYWNMNYHVEHHMFPMVPYHQLPKLHEAIKGDCPPPYSSSIAAYREILPALLRQISDPNHYAERPIPAPTHASAPSV
jgi:fatty acid desaturase